ncbi:hypothetical protein SAMN06272737_1612 [Blastococcus mobilis]|uniref:Uncharacterized protein n=1 Tax=Blastococcus mobilis TaxID=1938746 RepID=A0A239AWN9_9ACTN|nr:hypothetical protein SAMN06272737_1612 [Blastococcus mobilis]
MRPAALPGRPGQGGADRLDQPAVGIGGHQLDSAEAAGGQVAEEGQPAGAVLGGSDLQAEDLPVPVGIHPGRHQRVHVDHPAALADLEHQGVGGDEGVGPGIQRPVAELGDLRVEVPGHLADLGLAQPGDAQALDQLLHPAGGDAEQVAGGDHGGQRPLGPAAALEQPVGEVRPGAQLGDRHLQRAGAGVELPGPVAVAAVRAGLAALAIAGAADCIGLGRHERVDERGEHLPQQIGAGLGQLLVEEGGGVDTARCGHRVELLKDCGRSPEDHAVAASTFRARYSPGPSYTTLADATYDAAGFRVLERVLSVPLPGHPDGRPPTGVALSPGAENGAPRGA